MLDAVYLLCIAPLEFFMRLVFDTSMEWFHSPGVALVFMSLVVNTVILPIYNKAEGWQEEERALKRRFAGKEAAIRAVFRGQERFAMLATLYRQHGYSRCMALRSSIGFLLQIPFFFAAYHLLSGMEILRGQAFGPLADLGAPDGLLVIGGLHINVLPLIMTVVNLLSAFVYTHQLSRRDKIQLYALSGLFLIALYHSPAALTLYWTLNNVYSLGKNIVEKNLLPTWRMKGETSETSGLGIRIVRSVLMAAEKLCPANRLAWCLLAASVASFGILYKTSIVGEPARTVALLCLEMFSLGPVAGLALRMGKLRERYPQAAFLALTATLCFVAALGIRIGLYYSGVANVDLVNHTVTLKIARCWGVLVLFWMLLVLSRRLERRLGADDAREYSSLALSAWNMLCLLCFAAVPVAFYASDPESMGSSLHVMLPELAAYGLATALAGTFIIRLLPAGVGAVTAFLASGAALASFFYAFVFTGDYGVLNDFHLAHPQSLKASGNVWRDAAILLATCGTVAAALLFRKTAWLRHVFVVLCLALVVGAGWQIASVADVEREKLAVREAEKERERLLLTTPPADLLPAYTVPLLEFSSTEKNLLIIVLDMFTGDHFSYLLEEYPELKPAFAGFVWYPDTLSVGGHTTLGLPAIHGGEPYTMWSINGRRDGSIYSQYAKSYTLLPGLLVPLGFECSLGGVQLTTAEAVRKKLPEGVDACIVGEDFLRDYALYWRAAHHFPLPETNAARFLLAVSQFKCSPYSQRGRIYENGKWHIGRQALNTAVTVHSFGALDSLAVTASVRAKKSTYKYLYFSSTHAGTIFSPETGFPILSGEPPRGDFNWRKKYSAIDYLHFISEWTSLRSLARFFAWMKENGVWDNTRIIIAADHGWRDSQALYDCLGLVPQSGVLYPAKEKPGLSQPLLLSKDFHARGDLRISREYMSNADVPEMLVEGIATLDPALQSGYALRARPDRKRFYFSSNQSLPECRPGYTFQVTGSMFDKKHWQLIGEEHCR